MNYSQMFLSANVLFGGYGNVSRLNSYLPQCMYAVSDLGHVFAIVHICCFRIEYLQADTIQKGQDSFDSLDCSWT